MIWGFVKSFYGLPRACVLNRANDRAFRRGGLGGVFFARTFISLAVALALLVGLPGCGSDASGAAEGASGAETGSLFSGWASADDDSLLLGQEEALEALATLQAGAGSSGAAASSATSSASSAIPDYNGYPSVAVNGNVPLFSEADLALAQGGAFEEYADLDPLGRAMCAAACAGPETLPTEERGSISEVHPTGWHSSRYDWIDGGLLYNRCHLAGYQITAENANEKNLITGTRYMNVDGMLPYENEVADYIYETGGHVLYRVTPVYCDDELVARGVLMEAFSVEDEGEDLSFCVYCFNVQPGVAIDYATGDNALDESSVAGSSAQGLASGGSGGSADGTGSGGAAGNAAAAAGAGSSASDAPSGGQSASGGQQYDYILNRGSKKIHRPSCESVEDMKAANKLGFTGTLEEAEALGYEPCGRCNPR